MAKFPAMPLWTDAYLGDTTHLTTIEHGAYLLLLIVAWRSGGSLPNDDAVLARYARLGPKQWRRMKPSIMPFFTVEGDRIFQKKQRETFIAVGQRHEKAKTAGRAGGIAKALKTKELALAELDLSHSKKLPTKTKTKEEKEREDKSSPKKAGAWKAGDPIPEQWIEWARQDQRWPERKARYEAQRFSDYCLANRKSYADWMAAWRNWCRSPFQKPVASEEDQRKLTI